VTCTTANAALVGRGVRNASLAPGKVEIASGLYTNTRDAIKAFPQADRLSAFDGATFLGTLIDAGRTGTFAFGPDGRSVGAYRNRRDALRALPLQVLGRAAA
jgi:hypothetical protein